MTNDDRGVTDHAELKSDEQTTGGATHTDTHTHTHIHTEVMTDGSSHSFALPAYSVWCSRCVVAIH